MTSLEHLFISGTRIREVSALGYDVSDLVPPHVVSAAPEARARLTGSRRTAAPMAEATPACTERVDDDTRRCTIARYT
jgi:hypothetical protein